jgi:tripartite ATP-independent transporter DctP family solute receptor
MPLARLLGGVLVAALAMPAADAREFHSSDVFSFDYPTVQAVAYVDKVMRARSQGRLRIATLGYDDRDSENYTAAQVRNGTLDMARINLGVLNSFAPATTVPSLPYLFKSPAHARRILDGPIGEEILASLEAQGLIGLCFYDGGPRHFYSTKKAIRTPADLKGLKVRVQQGDAWAGMLRALGAEPVAIPGDRVYRSLQAGIVDAAEQSWPAYVTARHYAVAPYFSLTGHSMAPSVLVFSKQAWDTLAAEDQTIIRGAAKESVEVMRKLWDDMETSGQGTIEAAGAQVTGDVDRKAFTDALVPLYPTMLEGSSLQSMVRRIQADEPLEQSNR